MPGYSTAEVKTLKKFGKVIKQRRDELGISQEELAERSGLHRTYIGGVEQGRRNLSLINILKLAGSLETEPSEIFTKMT